MAAISSVFRSPITSSPSTKTFFSPFLQDKEKSLSYFLEEAEKRKDQPLEILHLLEDLKEALSRLKSLQGLSEEEALSKLKAWIANPYWLLPIIGEGKLLFLKREKDHFIIIHPYNKKSSVSFLTKEGKIKIPFVRSYEGCAQFERKAFISLLADLIQNKTQGKIENTLYECLPSLLEGREVVYSEEQERGFSKTEKDNASLFKSLSALAHYYLIQKPQINSLTAKKAYKRFQFQMLDDMLKQMQALPPHQRIFLFEGRTQEEVLNYFASFAKRLFAKKIINKDQLTPFLQKIAFFENESLSEINRCMPPSFSLPIRDAGHLDFSLSPVNPLTEPYFTPETLPAMTSLSLNMSAIPQQIDFSLQYPIDLKRDLSDFVEGMRIALTKLPKKEATCNLLLGQMETYICSLSWDTVVRLDRKTTLSSLFLLLQILGYLGEASTSGIKDSLAFILFTYIHRLTFEDTPSNPIFSWAVWYYFLARHKNPTSYLSTKLHSFVASSLKYFYPQEEMPLDLLEEVLFRSTNPLEALTQLKGFFNLQEDPARLLTQAHFLKEEQVAFVNAPENSLVLQSYLILATLLQGSLSIKTPPRDEGSLPFNLTRKERGKLSFFNLSANIDKGVFVSSLQFKTAREEILASVHNHFDAEVKHTFLAQDSSFLAHVPPVEKEDLARLRYLSRNPKSDRLLLGRESLLGLDTQASYRLACIGVCRQSGLDSLLEFAKSNWMLFAKKSFQWFFYEQLFSFSRSVSWETSDFIQNQLLPFCQAIFSHFIEALEPQAALFFISLSIYCLRFLKDKKAAALSIKAKIDQALAKEPPLSYLDRMSFHFMRFILRAYTQDTTCDEESALDYLCFDLSPTFFFSSLYPEFDHNMIAKQVGKARAPVLTLLQEQEGIRKRVLNKLASFATSVEVQENWEVSENEIGFCSTSYVLVLSSKKLMLKEDPRYCLLHTLHALKHSEAIRKLSKGQPFSISARQGKVQIPELNLHIHSDDTSYEGSHQIQKTINGKTFSYCKDFSLLCPLPQIKKAHPFLLQEDNTFWIRRVDPRTIEMAIQTPQEEYFFITLTSQPGGTFTYDISLPDGRKVAPFESLKNSLKTRLEMIAPKEEWLCLQDPSNPHTLHTLVLVSHRLEFSVTLKEGNYVAYSKEYPPYYLCSSNAVRGTIVLQKENGNTLILYPLSALGKEAKKKAFVTVYLLEDGKVICNNRLSAWYYAYLNMEKENWDSAYRHLNYELDDSPLNPQEERLLNKIKASLLSKNSLQAKALFLKVILLDATARRLKDKEAYLSSKEEVLTGVRSYLQGIQSKNNFFFFLSKEEQNQLKTILLQSLRYFFVKPEFTLDTEWLLVSYIWDEALVDSLDPEDKKDLTLFVWSFFQKSGRVDTERKMLFNWQKIAPLLGDELLGSFPLKDTLSLKDFLAHFCSLYALARHNEEVKEELTLYLFRHKAVLGHPLQHQLIDMLLSVIKNRHAYPSSDQLVKALQTLKKTPDPEAENRLKRVFALKQEIEGIIALVLRILRKLQKFLSEVASVLISSFTSTDNPLFKPACPITLPPNLLAEADIRLKNEIKDARLDELANVQEALSIRLKKHLLELLQKANQDRLYSSLITTSRIEESLLQKCLLEGSLYPLLEQGLSPEQANRCILDYALYLIELTRSQWLEKALRSKTNEKVRACLDQERVYCPSRETLFYLLYEASQNLFLRKDQLEMLQNIQKNSKTTSTLVQMDPGYGKTSVIAPALSLNSPQAITHVFPPSHFYSHSNTLRRILTQLGIFLQSFSFDRSITNKAAEAKRDLLRRANERGSLTTTPQSLKAALAHFLMALSDASEATGVTDSSLTQIQTLAQILERLRKRKLLIDEKLDQSQFEYPKGHFCPLAETTYETLETIFQVFLELMPHFSQVPQKLFLKEEYEKELLPPLTLRLYERLGINSFLSVEAFSSFLKKEPVDISFLEEKWQQKLGLIRASLCFFLPDALSQSIGVHYGFSLLHPSHKAAIPYFSQEMPKETLSCMSHFTDPIDTVFKTFALYFYKGLSKDQLLLLFNKLNTSSSFPGEVAEKIRVIIGKSVLAISAKDIQTHLANLKHQKDLIFLYLRHFVLEQIGSHEKSILISNALLLEFFKNTTFSATPTEPFAHKAGCLFLDAGSEGTKDLRMQIKADVPYPLVQEGTLQVDITPYHALIDVGGWSCDVGTLEMVQLLAKSLGNTVDGVVYFDSTYQDFRCLDIKTQTVQPYDKNSQRRLFIFFDPARSKASDCPIPDNAQILILLRSTTTLSDLEQAIGRARMHLKPGNKQILCALSPDFYNTLPKDISAKALLEKLSENERAQKQNQSLSSLVDQMKSTLLNEVLMALISTALHNPYLAKEYFKEVYALFVSSLTPDEGYSTASLERGAIDYLEEQANFLRSRLDELSFVSDEVKERIRCQLKNLFNLAIQKRGEDHLPRKIQQINPSSQNERMAEVSLEKETEASTDPIQDTPKIPWAYRVHLFEPGWDKAPFNVVEFAGRVFSSFRNAPCFTRWKALFLERFQNKTLYLLTQGAISLYLAWKVGSLILPILISLGVGYLAYQLIASQKPEKPYFYSPYAFVQTEDSNYNNLLISCNFLTPTSQLRHQKNPSSYAVILDGSSKLLLLDPYDERLLSRALQEQSATSARKIALISSSGNVLKTSKALTEEEKKQAKQLVSQAEGFLLDLRQL